VSRSISLLTLYPPRNSLDLIACLLALVVAAKECDTVGHLAPESVGATAHCTSRAWANTRDVSGSLQQGAAAGDILTPNSCLKLARKECNLARVAFCRLVLGSLLANDVVAVCEGHCVLVLFFGCFFRDGLSFVQTSVTLASFDACLLSLTAVLYRRCFVV